MLSNAAERQNDIVNMHLSVGNLALDALSFERSPFASLWPFLLTDSIAVRSLRSVRTMAARTIASVGQLTSSLRACESQELRLSLSEPILGGKFIWCIPLAFDT